MARTHRKIRHASGHGSIHHGDPVRRGSRPLERNDHRLGAAGVDWDRVGASLDEDGFALTGALLDPEACRALAARYDDDGRYRSTVVMARHGFGRGEYRYFDYPLPTPVQALRQALYPPLATVANRWMERLRDDRRFPGTLDEFLARCHAAGQRRPTPLVLRYGASDYNCLHQDLYGELAFPLQVAVLLDEPGRDFSGGELVLVEQRPRQQSRAEVVPLRQGEGVVFAVSARPRRGARGYHRAVLRHGVSRVRAGRRHTLGVIFHDAA